MKAKKRCAWCAGDPLLERYHDIEWGKPIRGERELFERLILEIFQAGLNWRMVVHKRRAFRRAFSGFSPARVASFGKRDVGRLLRDEGIIRNRLKIEAAIENARVVLELKKEFGSFNKYLGSLDGMDEGALFREFKKRFRFMGPKIAESFLQSIGRLPTPHEEGCWMGGK